MKLTARLVTFLMFCMACLILIDSYILVQRTQRMWYDDVQRSAHLLGLAMQKMIPALWKEQGRKRALKLIQEANMQAEYVDIEWLEPLPTLQSSPHSRVIRSEMDTKQHLLLSYVPVSVPAGWGILKISQSMVQLEKHLNQMLYRSIAWIVGIGMLGMFVVFVFGYNTVGKRLQQLVEKTRRIGRGEDPTSIQIRGHDELAELAASLDEMSLQIRHAQSRVREETKARSEATERLRQVDRLSVVGQLASGVAHELGTPLNVIAGRATLLGKNILSAQESAHSIQVILEQTEHMTKIIRQLLDFARRRSPKPSWIKVWQLCHQVVALLEPLAQKLKIRLVLENKHVEEMGFVEGNQLHQVLTNLVMNAIQASSPGQCVHLGVVLERRVPPEQPEQQEQPYLCIFVQDEGRGILPEHLPHLFEPFFTTKDVGEGTGLGLSIAYGIVQEHHGWIEVNSSPGQGSRFAIFLPQENHAWKKQQDMS